MIGKAEIPSLQLHLWDHTCSMQCLTSMLFFLSAWLRPRLGYDPSLVTTPTFDPVFRQACWSLWICQAFESVILFTSSLTRLLLSPSSWLVIAYLYTWPSLGSHLSCTASLVHYTSSFWSYFGTYRVLTAEGCALTNCRLFKNVLV
jgi:hypothetical protein